MMKKTVAVWTLAAMLSLGTATISAMAAEGWAQSGNSWVYYDANGNRVYSEWKKGADNQWRYLDGDGTMATNTWVESDYYVDSNGIMLTDKWLKLTDDDGKYEWYYFGSSGKKIDDTWKKIDDQWYHFDDDGRMELGWILDNMYYTGNDGIMRTGWQKLVPPDDYDDYENKVVPGYDSGISGDDGKYWFYFSSNGKKYVPGDSSGEEYGVRKVDGIYYCFDEDGIMQTGWKKVRDGSDDSIENYMYFGSDGKAKIGWYSIQPPDEIDGYDEDVEWFYFSNNGKPKASDSDRLSVSDIVKLDGKSYLFNELGNPVYGLKKVYLGSGEDNWTAFYFGTRDKSCAQKGKIKVEEDDGNTSTFYFSDNGRGYTGVKDNYLYYKGKLQQATDGQKYVCYRVDGHNYVVNSSGKVMKSTSVKNSDGVKFTTNSSGVLTEADEDTDVDAYVAEPEEPLCTD
ncbi:MAG: cell wall-binding protein [Enterocloster sp.]